MATISKTLSISAENDGQIVNVNWTANEEVLNYFQHTINVYTTYVPIFESKVKTGNRTFNIKNLRVQNLSSVEYIYLKIYHETGNPTFVEISPKASFVLSTLLADNSTTAGGEVITKIEASSPSATKIRIVHVS